MRFPQTLPPALSRRLPRPTPVVAVTVWFVLMAPLTLWGLPAPEQDRLLFAGQPPWASERYAAREALAEFERRDLGADVDIDPIEQRDQIVNLTDTPADQAALYLRYRLYSRQPDEHITFRALQAVEPAQLDFDPELYQYGGGWIYLVAAALGVSHVAGAINLFSDVDTFLQQPALFARFYVIARLLSLGFGALLLIAVFHLGRLSLGRATGWLAMLLLAAAPVFISGVLEAKPHVATACLLAWTTVAAWQFYEHRRPTHAVLMGVGLGYACGLTPLGFVGFATIGVLMMLVRRHKRMEAKYPSGRWLLAAAGLALVTYAVTNPYVIAHALMGANVLQGNVANTAGMYSVANVGAGISRVSALMSLALGFGTLLLGLGGLVLALYRGQRPTLLCGVAPALLFLTLGLVAAGKPAEFARFLVFPAMMLTVTGAVLVRLVAKKSQVIAAALVLLTLATAPTVDYLGAFVRDASVVHETRYRAGLFIEREIPLHEAIGVIQEPAPYAIPPMDFSARTVLLLPKSEPLAPAKLPNWVIATADSPEGGLGTPWAAHYKLARRFGASSEHLSPITWANKPVLVYRKQQTSATP